MARIERALLLGLLMVPALSLSPVAAQEPMAPRQESIPLEREGPRSVFDLVGFVGWIAPLNDITNDPASVATSLKPSVSFGVEGTHWLGRGFGIGFHGFWALSELDVTPNVVTAEVPDGLGDANYFSAVVNALYRLPVTGPAATVQPYFLLGGGVRHLAVSEEAAPTVKDATDPQLTLGLGAFVQVASSLTVRFGLRDFVSVFDGPESDSQLQNDIVVSVGVGYRFF
jgi:hypothetical protein